MTATTLQGVTTTGIYCRADCVARPHPRHVQRYPSPVAAEAAGFRPCLRCRPDRLPERSPHAPDAVAQALVLIADGYLDHHHEDELAAKVGYSARQLRRLFDDHVGASPDFVARSRRAHFARRLLDETELAVGDIAFASGFSSVRQMNRVVKEVFGFSPTGLRERRRRGDLLTTDGGLRLRVPHDPAIPVAEMIDYLAVRAIPGVEQIVDGAYRRTMVACGHPGIIEIRPSPHGDHLDVCAHLPTFTSVIDEVSRVRQLFATDEDTVDAVTALRRDPLLGHSVRQRPGLRLPGPWDRFETALRVVVGQQVTVAAASTMTGRLARRCGTVVAIGDDHLDVLFPAPDDVAEADLNGLGFTTRRADTIRVVASAVAAGDIDLTRRGDLDDIIEQWCALPGIGPWTAHVLAARVHRHRDAFPASDLGLRRSASPATPSRPMSTGELDHLAERWRPHRAVAAAHLWFPDPRKDRP
ncbi:MAG: helix-turn-helix domain-containing protein [Acidimicrobiia bacterium]|nr:helix-turn-helix domain-containing protein [Acidimicrobiia bacterium]